MALCNNEHQLLPEAGRYRCSKCSRCRPVELHWGCSSCKYDVCSKCLPPPLLSQYMVNMISKLIHVKEQQEKMIEEWRRSGRNDMSVWDHLKEKDCLQRCLEAHYKLGSAVIAGPEAHNPEAAAKKSRAEPKDQSLQSDMEYTAEVQRGKRPPAFVASPVDYCLLGHALSPAYGAGICDKCDSNYLYVGAPYHGCMTCEYRVCSRCNSNPPPSELECSLAAVKDLGDAIDTTMAYIEAFRAGEEDLRGTIATQLAEFGKLGKAFDNLVLCPEKYPELKQAHDELAKKIANFQERGLTVGKELAAKPKPAPTKPAAPVAKAGSGTTTPAAANNIGPPRAATPHPPHLPPPSTFKCSAGHPLVHRVPAYAWKCDYCSKKFPLGSTSDYNCHDCIFDACLQCVGAGKAANPPRPSSPSPSAITRSARTDPAPTPTPHPEHLPDPSTFKCKAGHPLQHRVPAYNWKCDYCAKSGVKGVADYSCHPCMFDVCLDCVAGGAAAASAPPPASVLSAPNPIAAPKTPVFRAVVEKTPCPEPTITPTAHGVVVHITNIAGLPTKSKELCCRIMCGGNSIESKKFNPLTDFQKPNKRDFRYMFNWSNTLPLEFEFFEKKTIGSDKKIASCRIPPEQIASANFIEFVPQSTTCQPNGSLSVRLLLAGSGLCGITSAPAAMQESHMRGVVEKAAKKTKGLAGDFATKDMKVQCTIAVDAIVTRIISFGENRYNASRIAPIYGDIEDTRRNCRCREPVSPWVYEVRVPTAFETNTVNIAQPDTEKVITCEQCGGKGKLVCHECNGRARITCGSCGGSGSRTEWNSELQRDVPVTCCFCDGRGWNDCGTCGATGWLPCTTCDCRGVVLFWWVSVISFSFTIDGVPHSWSACDELKDEYDFLKPKILNESQGTIIWQDEVPAFTKAPFVPKILQADSEAVFRISQQTVQKGFAVLHQQKVVLARIPVTQLCYYHPHDKIQRFFWAVGEGKVTVTVAAHPRHLIGSIMDTSTDGWVVLSEADAKMAMKVEVKSSQVKDKSYKSRAVAAASISGSIYKMGGGLNSHLQLRDFALVGNELMWFEQEEKKGGVCLAGVQQRNITLSDKPTKLSAGDALGARSLFGSSKDKDSPFKKGGEGWSLYIRLAQKTYHLVFVDQKVAQNWLSALHAAISAPTKQV